MLSEYLETQLFHDVIGVLCERLCPGNDVKVRQAVGARGPLGLKETKFYYYYYYFAEPQSHPFGDV